MATRGTSQGPVLASKSARRDT